VRYRTPERCGGGEYARWRPSDPLRGDRRDLPETKRPGVIIEELQQAGVVVTLRVPRLSAGLGSTFNYIDDALTH
jgi:hypothetical protein